MRTVTHRQNLCCLMGRCILVDHFIDEVDGTEVYLACIIDVSLTRMRKSFPSTRPPPLVVIPTASTVGVSSLCAQSQRQHLTPLQPGFLAEQVGVVRKKACTRYGVLTTVQYSAVNSILIASVLKPNFKKKGHHDRRTTFNGPGHSPDSTGPAINSLCAVGEVTGERRWRLRSEDTCQGQRREWYHYTR